VKLKTSTETGNAKIESEDKPKTAVAPKMARPEASKGINKGKFRKGYKQAPPKAQPKHETEIESSTSKSHWAKMPKSCIVDQLAKRKVRLAKSTLAKNKDALAKIILSMSSALAV
jgi:hypothetical protein